MKKISILSLIVIGSFYGSELLATPKVYSDKGVQLLVDIIYDNIPGAQPNFENQVWVDQFTAKNLNEALAVNGISCYLPNVYVYCSNPVRLTQDKILGVLEQCPGSTEVSTPVQANIGPCTAQ